MAGSAVQAQDAATLLKQMRAAETKAQFSATQITRRNGRQETAHLFRDGLKRRLEWLEPSVRRGDVLVDDGTNVWLYHRADNAVTQTKSASRAPMLGGSWNVAKKDGDFVLKRGSSELTIDGTRKHIVRFENGPTVVGLTNIDYGTVDDTKFRFVVPSGARLTKIDGQYYYNLANARRAANWFKVPAKLPEFDFESAVVGNDEVWLRYTDGARRISIFQQKAPGGNIDPQRVDGGWFWRSGGIRFLATGGPDSVILGLTKSLK